jgi:hypothetical protein
MNNKSKIKTEAIKIERGRKVDVKLDDESDFLPARDVADLVQTLQIYEAEIENMRQWTGEHFGNPVGAAVKRRLKQAGDELKRLETLISK